MKDYDVTEINLETARQAYEAAIWGLASKPTNWGDIRLSLKKCVGIIHMLYALGDVETVERVPKPLDIDRLSNCSVLLAIVGEGLRERYFPIDHDLNPSYTNFQSGRQLVTF